MSFLNRGSPLTPRLSSGPDTFFFFFFQAEDGIRDLTVTGVQTCALPISDRRRGALRDRRRLDPGHPLVDGREQALDLGRRRRPRVRPVAGAARGRLREIGRASCRERV